MIPVLITKMHIAEAIRRIRRDGVPPRRGARDYCLVTNGKHFPPKYTIAVAHQIATGKCLRPDQFSGGTESIRFLGSRGFRVVECTCGGALHSRPVPTAPDSSGTNGRPVAPTRHSERCRECKIRIRELLERIYGTCRPNHRFRWPTDLTAYSGTSIHPALRNVASALEAFRGFAVSDFARSVMLAPCDFWIPQPGFVVEFDESQHFTYPRKIGLSAYPHEQPLGFSAKRWIGLCEHHDVKDNHPPYRDEQRAWYDTLRDLAPSLDRSQPTVRLYARDLIWCSLDPDNSDDRQRFSALLPRRRPPSSRTMTGTRAAAVRTASTVRVAMVFPRLTRKASNGVPPSGHGAQRPVVPTATSFAGEKVDFALFPEGYINSSDAKRSASLTKLASELGVPLLVGAIDEDSHATGRARQVLLRFEPDGSSSLLYTKHSTAKGVAFEKPDWEPSVMIPTFELAGVSAGATICHDHYLGLLPRFLARCGARLWVNPSYQNVTDIKWSSILRLRAVENRFFALCTLHCDVHGRETHPFALAPDGSELFARPAGSDVSMPLSECRESGTILHHRSRHGRSRTAARLVEAPNGRETEERPERTSSKARPCCAERRAAGRPRTLGLERCPWAFACCNQPRAGLRGDGSEGANSRCGRVLSSARPREGDGVCPNPLEPLGSASDRFGASGDIDDGSDNRMLRPDRGFGQRRDS